MKGTDLHPNMTEDGVYQLMADLFGVEGVMGAALVVVQGGDLYALKLEPLNLDMIGAVVRTLKTGTVEVERMYTERDWQDKQKSETESLNPLNLKNVPSNAASDRFSSLYSRARKGL